MTDQTAHGAVKVEHFDGLLPCPFCGGDVLITHIEAHDHTPALKSVIPDLDPAEDTWWPECPHCGCGHTGKNTREEAIAAWNTRASLSPTTTDAVRGEVDPHRILKNALFAIEKLKSPPVSYGGVLTDNGKYAWLRYTLEEQSTLHPSPEDPSGGQDVERYGASRFDLAAPGDRQKQRWVLRFDDADRREMHFTDEAEAWAAWNQFSPSWNCYLFTIAALRAPVERKGEGKAIYEECAAIAESHRAPSGVPQSDYDQACTDIATAIRAAGDKA